MALLAGVMVLPAAAEPPKTFFSGDWCIVEPLDEGVVTELGNGHLRITEFNHDVWITTDPRISGNETFDLTIIVDANLRGPAFGSIEIVNDGGSWSGQVVGKLSMDGDRLYMTMQGTAVGKGGYQGLVAKFASDGYPGAPPAGCYFTVSGHIVETGAAK